MGVIASARARRITPKVENRTIGSGDPLMHLTRKQRVIAVAAISSIVVAVFLGLILIPVPQRFSLHNEYVTINEVGCSGISPTSGTTVTFSWNAPTVVDFGAWSCSSNSLVYWANGTSGAGSFLAHGGAYEFGSYCAHGSPCWAANVSGAYTAPLLEL